MRYSTLRTISVGLAILTLYASIGIGAVIAGLVAASALGFDAADTRVVAARVAR